MSNRTTNNNLIENVIHNSNTRNTPIKQSRELNPPSTINRFLTSLITGFTSVGQGLSKQHSEDLIGK